MLVLDAGQVRDGLPWEALVDALRNMVRDGCETPERHHHHIESPTGPATMLIMPAWQAGRASGVKIVNVHPANAARGLPAIFGTYVLFDGQTGQTRAVMDGGELTARRTAATSALAARHLARADARCHLVVGTGRLSLNLIEAHRCTTSVKRTLLWGRSFEKAQAVAHQARQLGFDAEAVDDLAPAVRSADIVTCATLSHEVLVRGEWLRPGTHVDLVGAFKPEMREADDALLRDADLLIADNRAGVLQEAGDVLQAMASGAITADKVEAELADLVRGRHPGRTSASQVTVFKSVGSALTDLAAALLVASRHARCSPADASALAPPCAA